MNQNSMSSIDQRTQLAGSNRLELLLFKLQDGQTYGINVFKIREILKKTEMNRLPNSSQ
jgi:two-component system chemotaxis response regulator CheV